jgi:hypothetical protein
MMRVFFNGGGSEEERKRFFFEKKKQKTFISMGEPWGGEVGRGGSR